MPIPSTARSYTGAHVTTGYDASGRRASKSTVTRKSRKSSKRGGRK